MLRTSTHVCAIANKTQARSLIEAKARDCSDTCRNASVADSHSVLYLQCPLCRRCPGTLQSARFIEKAIISEARHQPGRMILTNDGGDGGNVHRPGNLPSSETDILAVEKIWLVETHRLDRPSLWEVWGDNCATLICARTDLNKALDRWRGNQADDSCMTGSSSSYMWFLRSIGLQESFI